MQITVASRELDEAIELEQLVLGGVLLDNDALASVRFLRAEHFSEEFHARLFEIIMTMIEAGKRASAITVRPYLPADLMVGDQSVGAYLGRLLGAAMPSSHLPDLAGVVLELSVRRQSMAIASTMVERLAGAVREPFQAIATDAIDGLDKLMRDAGFSRAPRMSLGEAARKAREDGMAAKARGGLVGATWGLADLDNRTPGLVGGDFIVIGGRPSMGKTAVAVGVALATARMGNGVGYISLEMTAPQLGVRALSALSTGSGDPILYEDVLRGDVPEDWARRLDRSQAELDTLPFLIEQEAGLTLSQISGRIRQMKQQFARRPAWKGTGEAPRLRLVVVDHIGLIKADDTRGGNKAAETTDVTGGLKRLAKTEDVCIMGLAQIGRGVEARDDKRPTMADLKWSGSLEEDADMVVGLYREEYYLLRAGNLNEVQIDRLNYVRNKLEANLLKLRQGRPGVVPLYCQIASNTLGNWSHG